MTDFHPYRPRNPSPWPRRILIAVSIAVIAAVLYAYGASAAGPRPPRLDDTTKRSRPNTTAVCKYAPQSAVYPDCVRSHQPVRR